MFCVASIKNMDYDDQIGFNSGFNMMQERKRTFEYRGKRRVIIMSELVWSGLDVLTERKGKKKWHELATEWLDEETHMMSVAEARGEEVPAFNMTGIIRDRITYELQKELELSERAEMHSGSLSPVWQSFGECTDEAFDEALEVMRKHDGTVLGITDQIGFQITAATCEHGTVAFYIRNGHRDGNHIIITTPFTEQEWEAKQ